MLILIYVVKLLFKALGISYSFLSRDGLMLSKVRQRVLVIIRKDAKDTHSSIIASYKNRLF